MRIQEIIGKKRDGNALSEGEIAETVQAYTRGDLPDYQIAALLMAIYLRGMDGAETAALTAAMAASGRQLDLAALLPSDRPTLDKHSTGGVGDKTSLVVVPILAAAGVRVCKMSGRGLGHTGGTLDKLEAIPGFRVGLTPEEMVAQVARVGACLAGQTGDLAPADKKIYALRDATATVGSLPLIVSSILSKKLAGGAARFLFDVKVGGGALMKDIQQARELARALADGAARQGRPAVAVLSDMSQPLGYAIGNALEVAEAVHVLTPGSAPELVHARFRELCVFLSVQGLLLSGLEATQEAARARVEALLSDGAALHSFREVVAAQGGDTKVVDNPDLLPRAPVVHAVAATDSGFVAEIDAAMLGEAVVTLGGGRSRKEEAIDPSVGMIVRAPVGAPVTPGQVIVEIHAASESSAREAAARVRAAYGITARPVEEPTLIKEIYVSPDIAAAGR